MGRSAERSSPSAMAIASASSSHSAHRCSTYSSTSGRSVGILPSGHWFLPLSRSYRGPALSVLRGSSGPSSSCSRRSGTPAVFSTA
eukprot:scaffold98103_cov29-Tisochrysis_lutea.AAC.2